MTLPNYLFGDPARVRNRLEDGEHLTLNPCHSTSELFAESKEMSYQTDRCLQSVREECKVHLLLVTRAQAPIDRPNYRCTSQALAFSPRCLDVSILGSLHLNDDSLPAKTSPFRDNGSHGYCREKRSGPTADCEISLECAKSRENPSRHVEPTDRSEFVRLYVASGEWDLRVSELSVHVSPAGRQFRASFPRMWRIPTEQAS